MNNNNERNGNNIGDSGGCSIGEVLKVNSTLTELYLWDWGVNDVNDVIWWYLYELNNNNERNCNNIGEKGKKALREGKNSKLEIIIDWNSGPVYLWLDKKLVILTRWIVLQVMKVSLFWFVFAKVMGNEGFGDVG